MRLRLHKVSVASIIVLISLLSLLAPLLSACATSSSNAVNDAAPDSQQIFHEQLVPGASDVATMDPGIVKDAYSITPIEMIYPALVTLDARLNVIPWAASALPTVSDGGTVYTFHIRPGLKFTDGEAIDASAFAYAMNRSLDPCTASPVSYYLNAIKDAVTFSGETCTNGTYSAARSQSSPVLTTLIGDSLTVVDAQTLNVTLARPAAYFLEALTYPTSYAVPRNLIKQYGSTWTDHLAAASFGGNLFKLTKWDHKGNMVLRRNESFWGTKTRLREVDFTIFQDASAAYNNYLSGQNDTSVPTSAQYAQAQTRPDFHQAPVLWMNYFWPNWTIAPFDNLQVRQAFDLALNRETIANQVLHGTQIPSYHIVPQGMPGYDASLKNAEGTRSLAGDQQAARQLMSFYAASHCGGKLASCPAVVVDFPDGTNSAAVARAALQMWKAAFPGYPISLRSVDFTTLLRDVATKQVQFFMLSWIADYADSQDWLSLPFQPTSADNDGNVNMPLANTLMTQADADQNPTSRLNEYNQAEQLLVQNVAWIAFSQPKQFYTLRTYVHSYGLDAQGNEPLPAWQTAYIAPH